MFFARKSDQSANSKSQLEEDASSAAIYQAINRSRARVEFDMQGNVLAANDNFLQLMGFSSEELPGLNHKQLCPADVLNSPDYQTLWNELKQGRFVSNQFRRLRKDGSCIWLEATYNPIMNDDGEVIKVVKFATDITARMEESERMRSRMAAMERSNAVIEFDIEGNIVRANDNFTGTVGYSLDEILGKHHSIFCTPEFAASDEYRDFWRQLRRGEFVSGRFQRLTKQGDTVWLEASYNPLFDASGELTGFIKFATDITASVEQSQREAANALHAYELTKQTQKTSETGTKVIQAAADEMHKVAEAVTQAGHNIGELGKQSEQITSIVNTIRGIAEQTNLLALNAAIEAARAGDQGRGFAVVADEVRKLAGRTSQSTSEISDMIGKIQSGTEVSISSITQCQDQAHHSLELASQAGEVIVQIRQSTEEAVKAVSIFNEELNA